MTASCGPDCPFFQAKRVVTGSPAGWADEIRTPVTSSLRTRDKPATEEGDAAVAIEFDGWEVVR